MADASDNQIIDWAKKALRPFLRNNPGVRIESLTITEPPSTFAVLYNLWGDPSVAGILAQSNIALIAALNAVYLPPRYSAIYHKRLRRLEIIWRQRLTEDDAANSL